MNEQIEKIYGEACINFGYLDEREFLEKFVQLIIRACVLQCQHNDDMDRIEKHFGVEE
jgi:hypothetical protein